MLMYVHSTTCLADLQVYSVEIEINLVYSFWTTRIVDRMSILITLHESLSRDNMGEFLMNFSSLMY